MSSVCYSTWRLVNCLEEIRFVYNIIYSMLVGKLAPNTRRRGTMKFVFKTYLFILKGGTYMGVHREFHQNVDDNVFSIFVNINNKFSR